MPDRENSALRPMRSLRLLAHGDESDRVGRRVSSIGPYTISNRPNAAIQHPAERAIRLREYTFPMSQPANTRSGIWIKTCVTSRFRETAD